MEEAIVNQSFLVEKMEGKGGWTFVQIHGISQSRNAPFGMVRVKGFVDDFELNQYNLMPMGNGNLFLPLNIKLRKAIQKKAGDTVHIKLYLDNSPIIIPHEITLCLTDYPVAESVFYAFSENERKLYINWIYEAKHQTTRDNRIAKMIDKLLLGKKLHHI
jgi:predicted membrane protein